MTYKIEKTDAEWKALLQQKGAEPMAFDVARREATERAFTGKHAENKLPGTYTCICCGKPLFDAAAKFDSGTGWPSYFPATQRRRRGHQG
jgi:peptide-methionine (R)-S-oxide reductase